jgi:3-oxoacyl-[acyl-carrier protein] reductase
MPDLTDRVALVTGSSRGIGAAIATLFAAHGAHVAVHGRDPHATETVTSRIRQAGGHAIAVTGDVTRADQLDAMRDTIEQQLGPLDILVTNAGGSAARPGPIAELSEADWRQAIDTNLTATFLTIKAFLPAMSERGHGTIVTMSSAAARRPTAQSPLAYAVAKAGVELLTRELALHAGPAGVRINGIAPELILTERNQQQLPDAVQEPLRLAHPIQRLGLPEDVAEAALYLVSDCASWVSGVILDIAGGSVLA